MPKTKTKIVCHKCFAEIHLQNRVRREGKVQLCSFCGSRAKSVPIETVAEWVEDVLENHYEEGMIWPCYDDNDSWSHDDQEGDDLSFIISEIIEANEEVVEAVIEELTTLPWWEIKDGADPRYYSETNYVETDKTDYQVEEGWNYFRHQIKHRSRFFNDDARQFLDSLLRDLPALRVDHGKHTSVIRTLRPKDGILFYRARRTDQQSELEFTLAQPFEALGPPPPEKATAGRMNAEGVPVFYGALDRDTCVAELRPSLGSTVVSAGFNLVRKIRVLDFQLLEDSYHGEPLSYFQPDFKEKSTYRSLLRRLHAKICQPIVPGAEREYLITQVLADYLVNILQPPVDGVLFSSVQREGGINVVLFGHVLDIQLNKASPLGNGAALRLSEDCVRIHRIQAIKYECEDHNPNKKGKPFVATDLSFDDIEF